MSSTIPVGEVVFDEAIYPRKEWSQQTVNQYAEALTAGEQFPAIVLERETRRLLDGMHRWQAHKQALKDAIEVVFVDVPDDVPNAKVFAASLSAKHGDRVTGDDLKAITREVAEDNPDFDQKTLARYFGVTRQTIGRWTGDITERHHTLRKIRALLLTRAGWSMRQVGDYLAVNASTVLRDVSDDILQHLTEDLLREAATGLPEDFDAEAIIEEIRQERIFAQWSDEERDLLKRLRDGETIVVSLRADMHANLIGWADAAGLYMRIDRKTEWGNPFELPADGDRQAVIHNYETHYLPYKPSLLAKLAGLRGKALGCWCAPEPCHGHVLKAKAES